MMNQSANWPPERAHWKRFIVPALIVGITGAALYYSQSIRDNKPGYANIVLLITAAIVVFSSVTWFALATHFSRKIRFTPAIALAILMLTSFGLSMAGLIQFGWTGSMRPVVFWIGSSPDAPDEDIKPTEPSGDSEIAAATLDDQFRVSLTGDNGEIDSEANGTFPFYPQFLGPNRDGILGWLTLQTDWDQSPPRELWRHRIGAGWSGFAVAGQWAVTLEQRGEKEIVYCYQLTTGDVIWTESNDVRFSEFLGGLGPRSTPTINQGKVYAQGATGILKCIDLASGKLLWERDTLEDADAENVTWGKSGSPLVIDDMVIISAGGSDGKSLFAYEKETGDVIWSGGDDVSSYSSPALAEIGGLQQVLIVNQDFVVGHDLKTGRVLWRHDWPGNSGTNASISQPVPVGGDRVFLSKGYGHGCELIQVSRAADGIKWETKSVWKNPFMKTKFSNVVIHETNGRKYVYGMDERILECLDLETGERIWKRGRYGHSQIMLVGDVILVMTETAGEIVAVRATPEKHEELARFKVISGKTWNPPALAGKYLIVRNAEEVACFEMDVERKRRPEK